MLHEKNIQKFEALGRTKKNAEKVFAYLEANPIIEIRKTAEAIGIAYNTVAKIVDIFIEMEYLKKAKSLEIHRFIRMKNICKYSVKTQSNINTYTKSKDRYLNRYLSFLHFWWFK